MDTLPIEIVLEIIKYSGYWAHKNLLLVNKDVYNLIKSSPNDLDVVSFRKPFLPNVKIPSGTDFHVNPRFSTLFYHKVPSRDLEMLVAITPTEVECTRKILKGDEYLRYNNLDNYDFRNENAFSPPVSEVIVYFRLSDNSPDWFDISRHLQQYAFKVSTSNETSITIRHVVIAVLRQFEFPTTSYPNNNNNNTNNSDIARRLAKKAIKQVVKSYC